MIAILLFAVAATVLSFVAELFESKKRMPLSIPLITLILSLVVNYLIVLIFTPYFTHPLVGGNVWLGLSY